VQRRAKDNRQRRVESTEFMGISNFLGAPLGTQALNSYQNRKILQRESRTS
jgi:hypothetical protein